VYDSFFGEGEVVEIRAYGCSGKGPWDGWAKGVGIVFGYFDNAAAFHDAAVALDKAGAGGIYFTLNPVVPDLLGRAVNRLKAADIKSQTTADKSIQAVRWLPIDLDPIRAGGASDLNSSGPELAAAEAKQDDVAAWLKTELGLPVGHRAMSGNGAHLLVRLPDLPPTEETAAMIKKCLLAVAGKFTDSAVDVDRKVFNPARIWKLYGTTARKSDHTEARPQRRAMLGWARPLAEVPVADMAAVDRLAALAPTEPEQKKPPGSKSVGGAGEKRSNGAGGELGALDVAAYLGHYGVDFTEKPKGNVTLYVLRQCVFDESHQGRDAAICQDPGGKLTYQCFHNSCNGRTWREARALISGDDSVARFCAGYREDWNPPGRPEKPQRRGNPKAAGPVPDAPRPYVYFQGGSWRMDAAKASDYFQEMFRPMVAIGPSAARGSFLRYNPKTGVWDEVDAAWIRRKVSEDMDELRNPSWVEKVAAQLHTDLWVDEERMRPKGLYLCLKNGMWDVEKFELLPHSPRYLARYQLPVRYEPEADCPLWEKTLDGIFADDLSKVEVLRSFMGYVFFPRILFPGVLFAIGAGGNGKGVVEHVLNCLLGEDAVSHISLARMEDRFGLIEMKDKLLNTCGETETGMMDVSKFKLISAGDTVQAEGKYIGDTTFTPVAKHLISMNYFPHIAEKTRSFYRRITILEFAQNFDKDSADPLLKWKLEAELDGIFSWALEGLPVALENGCLVTNKGACDAIGQMQARNNPMMVFVEELCVVGPTVWTHSDDLYQRYRQWAEDGGMKPIGRQRFIDDLKLQFGVSRRKAGKRYILEGIGLQDLGD